LDFHKAKRNQEFCWSLVPGTRRRFRRIVLLQDVVVCYSKAHEEEKVLTSIPALAASTFSLQKH